MRYVLFSFCFLIVLVGCSTNSNDDYGILGDRPRIPVQAETQFSLATDIIQVQPLDLGLSFEESIVDSLENHLTYVHEKGNYQGLSVAMAVSNKGFWQSSIGESGTIVPLSVNTPFHALSLAKIFTSALTLRLVEMGYMQLETTIDNWFPDFPRANEISVYHLLMHTSGIQTYEVLKEFAYHQDTAFSPEALLNMAAAYPIEDSPGTFISYSNSGYVMLGCICEKVTGISFNDLLATHLIEPFHLENTYVVTPENLSNIGVKGYHQGTLIAGHQWPLTYAAGPVISTPTDLLILYSHLLAQNFLDDVSLGEMLSGMNRWKLSPDTYYGKGIYCICDTPSGSYLGHSGGTEGSRTCLFYNVDHHVFISMMSNESGTEIEPAMFSMCEKLINIIEIE